MKKYLVQNPHLSSTHENYEISKVTFHELLLNIYVQYPIAISKFQSVFKLVKKWFNYSSYKINGEIKMKKTHFSDKLTP